MATVSNYTEQSRQDALNSLRLDVGGACDRARGWQGVRGQCRRVKKSVVSGIKRQTNGPAAVKNESSDRKRWEQKKNGIQTGYFAPTDRGNIAGIADRRKRIDRLATSLENGAFAPKSSDSTQIADGKMQALSALRDSTNPRVGLIAARDKSGKPLGFMSYKPGSATISIESLGTSQATKGTGRELFNDVLRLAAKSGKGLSVSPGEEAIGFYKKMGMAGGMGDMEMTAKEVKQAYRKLNNQIISRRYSARSRQDTLRLLRE